MAATTPRHALMRSSTLKVIKTPHVLEIINSTCWDGINLSSLYNKSHVAYPQGSAASLSGIPMVSNSSEDCPSTHPVKTLQLTLKIAWDTRNVNSKADWPDDGSHPVVLSHCDVTGYGQHGDYVSGWKDTSLEEATDEATGCIGALYTSLKTQEPAAGNGCSTKLVVKKEQDGWIVSLHVMDGMVM